MKKLISIALTLAITLTLLPMGIVSVNAASEGDYNYTVVDGGAVITGYFGELETVYVPETLGGYPVTAIGESAFHHRKWIQYLTLPDSVTTIGKEAFWGCTLLVEMTFPKSLVSIGEGAFRDCYNLRRIVLPEGLKTIGDKAFHYCSSRFISYVVLPESLESIGSDVFTDCFDLKQVIYNGNSAAWKAVKVADRSAKAEWLDYVICKKDVPTVSAKLTSTGAKITWKPMYGVYCYYVYRRTVSGSKHSAWSLFDIVYDTCSSTDTTLKNGVKTEYAVSTVYEDWESGLGVSGSVFQIGTPKAKAAIVTKGIKVTWGKVGGAQKYIVQRRVGSGKWSTVKTTTATAYTDSKAAYGKSYSYRVKAVNGDVEKVSKATASLRRLKAPATLKITKAKTGFKATWKKVSGAKEYEVYRKVGNGSWKKVKTTKSVSYTDKSAKKGKYYTYRVRAAYGSSKSGYKASKKVKR